MPLKIKLILAYDGTKYRGWQKTVVGPSIEESLETVLHQILQENVQLDAASRTDAGVHANEQVVSFKTDKNYIDTDRLFMSLNRLLPKDIVIYAVEKMDESFHATLDCLGKEYRYFVCNGKVQHPTDRFYEWHFPYELDLEKMNLAKQYMIGEKNFSTLCNFKKNAKYAHYKREVTEIEIIEMSANKYCIIVRGKNFLYKMVRNIVGTLLYVGTGKISLDDLNEIMESRDRTKAGVTAAAHGLFLNKLFY